MHTKEGAEFNVTVLWQKVQITSLPERYFQCNFTRNSSSEILYPWVQIESLGGATPSVGVRLTGMGKIENNGRPNDCGYEPFEAPSPIPVPPEYIRTCDNDFFNESQIADQLWTDNIVN